MIKTTTKENRFFFLIFFFIFTLFFSIDNIAEKLAKIVVIFSFLGKNTKVLKTFF